MKDSRGSALITVILVVLVLTIVGIGIAYFTQLEDRISGNTRTSKALLYVADSGLRAGEAFFGDAGKAAISLSQILQYPGPEGYDAPGGPRAVLLSGIPFPTLPTGEQRAFLDVPIMTIDPNPSAGTPTPLATDRGTYSLYVRNNVEDPGGLTTDTDSVLNLVSVGKVAIGGGATVTRILEEQILVGFGGTEGCPEKQCNEGGTGAIGGR